MFQARGRAETALSFKEDLKEASRMGYKLTQWGARAATTARSPSERGAVALHRCAALSSRRPTGGRS